MIRANYTALIVFVGTLVFSTSVKALDITPNASLAMQATTRQFAENEEREVILITGVGAKINSDTGSFKLDADTSLQYDNYLDGDFENDHYLNLNAIADWVMLKDQVNWKLQDFFTQQSLNSLNPNTPDNIIDTNVFTFGPNIHYQISGRQLINLNPEYRAFSYQSQNLDNKQNAVNASWNYQIFRTFGLGVRGGINKLDYDDPLLIDNNFRNIHLTLSANHSDHNYSVDIGKTRIEQETGYSEQGTTGKLRWSFNLTGHSNITAYIASNLTDANSRLLNTSTNPDDGDFLHEQISAEVLWNDTIRLSYKRSDTALNSKAWIELHQQDYLTALLDRDISEAGFEFNYPLSALISTGINTRYSQIELTDVNRKDYQFRIGGKLNYRFSRYLHGVIAVKYQDENSSVDTADFSERSFYISLVYGYGG